MYVSIQAMKITTTMRPGCLSTSYYKNIQFVWSQILIDQQITIRKISNELNIGKSCA